jgi:aspartate 1-decarboxylase
MSKMIIEVLKSKIHRVRLTGVALHYVGSITIDEALLDAAGMIPNEKVQVVNVNNGARIETYIIKGERNSGIVELNGPAARTAYVGDTLIVISYAQMDFEAAKQWEPIIAFPDEFNRLPA